ncbi:MAG: dTMP kinase [bacterium]
MARAPFVTLEGIDGSGKSSTLKRVAQELRSEGVAVWPTREETAGPTGDWVRRAIAEHWPPLSVAFLFAADRARHVAEIEQHRAAGELVLCDRFIHSSLAYQSVTLAGAVADPAAFLRGLHAGWCPEPDRVVLFDSDPEKAVARTASRGATTPYEKVAFLRQVRANYLALAKAEPARFVVLDADQRADGLAKAALAAVRGALTA